MLAWPSAAFLALGRNGFRIPQVRLSPCITLLEAGCTTDEVKSITGHSTDEMVTHYGKKVNQRKLAKAAIDKLVGAGNGNKKRSRLTNPSEKPTNLKSRPPRNGGKHGRGERIRTSGF